MKKFFALMFVVTAMVISGCAKTEEAAAPPAAAPGTEVETEGAAAPPAEEAAK